MSTRSAQKSKAARGGSGRPGARPGPGAGAGRPPSRVPGRGIPLWRPGPWLLAAAGLVSAAVIVAAAVPWDGGGGSTADTIAERAAELQAREHARNAEHVSDLTELATEVQGGLLPVLEGLDRVVPSDDTADGTNGGGGDGAEAAAADWQQALEQAAEQFGDPPSASTEVNSTRGGLVLAVDLLRSAVDAHEASVVADPAQRDELVALADRLRDRAVDAWDLAALQLDMVNIEAGHGHVHLHLEAPPDGAVPDLGGFGGARDSGGEPPDGGFGG